MAVIALTNPPTVPSSLVNGTNENINRLTGTVADAVMKVNSDSELLDGSLTNLSDTVTRVTESTSRTYKSKNLL